jgi:predicted N-acyltransferase
VVAGADAAGIVRALNEAIEQIARERKTWLIVYKEPDRREAELLAPLKESGFVQAESLPMNRIVNQFASFAAMLGAMRSHYRYKIARSRKKFANSGLKLTRKTGRAAIEQLYTPALHAMYERVTRRAEHRLEILPREFFMELSARFPDELILTSITQGAEVLAFAWSLRYATIYHNLFVGIDYERNEETDAYFNLMVEDIAYAMEQPVGEIFVGQTADDFKSRLGCTADPRYLYIKVTSRWLQWCFLRMQSLFLTPPPAAPQRDVFKHEQSCVDVAI